MIQLVTFLGNIGNEYKNTRHNVAWLFENSLPFSHLLNWQKKFSGEYCSLKSNELLSLAEKYSLIEENSIHPKTCKTIFFLKPHTYMNLSGKSIAELSSFYKIKAENILTLHDELELPLGTVSLKYGGGLSGHNGLRSTKENLSTNDFWRFRFGIGRPAHKDVASYVLSPFTEDENISLEKVFSHAHAFFIKLILESNPAKFLPAWSKQKIDIS